MRTTLDIDVPILREVKALHESEGRSMGAIVSELLAEALGAPPLDARRPVVPLDVSRDEVSSRPRRQGGRLRGARRGSSVSYPVDANVLLYASDQSSDRHERARRFVAVIRRSFSRCRSHRVTPAKGQGYRI
jgi:hypothetical protein